VGLLAKHDVEAMFSGHAHNFWYDRIGTTDYYLAPATSFVRQDFSELQRSPPPDGSEHGRNDYAKLGYFIVRIFEKGNTVQFVRSFGAELYPGILAAPPRFLTRPPRENKAPCIGFDLRQNWAEICEVPPSGGLDEFDRKPVRNDYQILALIEMGVRDIRIPISDLRDPVRRLRLRALCHLGFRPTLFGFAIPNEADLALIEASRDYLFDWEITLDWPDLNRLRPDIARVHARMGLPIYLSRMRTEHDVPKGSVYHHVINHGFILKDTEQLNQLADLTEIGVSGAVFRLSTQLPVGTTLSEINTAATTRGLLASVHLRIADENPAVAHRVHETTCERVQKALEIMPALKATRLFCDTHADNDGGYFCRQGAIDRCGNPNPLLDIVRTAHRC
jgi:hypothetical protein